MFVPLVYWSVGYNIYFNRTLWLPVIIGAGFVIFGLNRERISSRSDAAVIISLLFIVVGLVWFRPTRDHYNFALFGLPFFLLISSSIVSILLLLAIRRPTVSEAH